jgi:hypothetical protein
LEFILKKRLRDDPLVQAADVWLDQFPRHKKWLGELAREGLIKDTLTEDDFYGIKALLEKADAPGKAGLLMDGRGEKLFFLFHCTAAMRFINSGMLEDGRIRALPLLFREDGTFHHYAAAVLEKIREYAGVNRNFDEQYRRVLEKNRSGPMAKRVPAYLVRGYPLELIAELEGLPPARLDRGLLPMFYWGAGVYGAYHDLVRGDKKTMRYDRVPRWNGGGGACLPFLDYAAMKRDFDLIDAVFAGAGTVDRIRCLAEVFCRHNGGGVENWTDEAGMGDFPGADEDVFYYRSREIMEINPDEVKKAKVFLGYTGRIVKKDTSDEALAAIRLFFSDIAGGTAVVSYLDYVYGLEKAGKEYRQFLETIARKAVSCDPGRLFSPETFRNYRGGCMGITGFAIIERYLELARPNNQADLMLIAKFICNALDNKTSDIPDPLNWLSAHPRLGDLITAYIDDPGFLLRLLDVPAEMNVEACVKFKWIHYFFSLWFLHAHGDGQHKAVWPVRLQLRLSDRVEGPEEGGMTYKAAEILLSEGAIRKEPLLSGFIWNLFEEDERWISDRDFIPYKYFLRVNGDIEKDRALLKAAGVHLKIELTVLRYLKTRGSFDADDFILNHVDTADFFSLPPEVFDLHRSSRGKIFWSYLRERGDTFEHFEKIAGGITRPGRKDWLAEAKKEADPYAAPYIDNAVNEGGDRYFELYKFLNVYYIAGESINRMLDEQAEKARALMDRAGKHLVLLRGIEKKEPEEKRYYHAASVCAAHFISERGPLWKALKPFLLAFRNSRRVLLRDNLSSNTVSRTERNPADEIFGLLCYAPEDGEKLKLLRRDMADSLADLLKPLPSKDRGDPRDREQNYGDAEKNLEGFDITYREPNPYWRCAYVRALDDLGVDTDGKGHFFHSLLEQVKDHDPSPAVRDAAEKTAKSLRNIREGWKQGSHKRHLIQAFWWLKRAHMLTLNSPINDREALKTRNTEYR